MRSPRSTTSSTLAVVAARVRTPAFVLGLALVLASPWHDSALVAWFGAALILLSVGSTFVGRLRVEQEPIVVASPVRGRWVAVNSPATKVPSHGVHSAGQTYAIDLVHWPADREPWRGVHSWPLMRRPEEFPGFGEPVVAPADAEVVKARDAWRDHWSRNSWPALVLAFAEGSLRELFGPGALLGNHVVLDLGDGSYAALAHLKRGSVVVREGDLVRAGQQVAECGNSGNTSEPHLHFQPMDSAHATIAAGLPFEFADVDVPENEEELVVPAS